MKARTPDHADSCSLLGWREEGDTDTCDRLLRPSFPSWTPSIGHEGYEPSDAMQRSNQRMERIGTVLGVIVFCIVGGLPGLLALTLHDGRAMRWASAYPLASRADAS